MNFNLKKNVVIEKLETKYLVLNIETGKYLETNESGGHLLQHLDEYNNYNDLLEFFAKRNNITIEKAREDLKNFLNKVESFGLITING